MIKVAWRLRCLVLVGASPTDQLGHLQAPASRRHGQGCVPFALPCLCRRQLHKAVGPPPGARIETTWYVKAVWRLHCLVLSEPAPQSTRATARCPHRDDMIKAVCQVHCLALVGVSSTEQSGHLRVLESRQHDQGCVIIALPCLCWRQLHRAVGPPSGARIETT